jgi:arsenate reductase
VAERPLNVLFLCTANSARSIMAESLLRHWGAGRFTAWSAGSFPRSEVNPQALSLLRQLQLPVDGLRSKSWDEFAAAGAPAMDFVITVCDRAAGEVCPVWPGQPMTAHWGIDDPAAVGGAEIDRQRAFRRALLELENRIKLFVNLPLHSLDRLRIHYELQKIGKSAADASAA